MKRVTGLYDMISTRENLREAFCKARKGARQSKAALAFESRLEENLCHLVEELLTQTVQPQPATQFVIHDPKERTITAPSFRDRVLHHAIMNVCEPHLDRWLIAHSFACRKGKGRLAALERATKYAQSHGWFLKLDIRGYFESIPHDRLLEELRRKFKDARLLVLLERLIRAHTGRAAAGCGLPIGSLLSQHLANFFLNPVDRLCREQLRTPGYVRYMDDFVLWEDDPARLNSHWRAVAALVQDRLGLVLKSTAHLNRTAHGMNFCGFRIFPGWRVLNRRSRRRFESRLRALDDGLAAGEMPEAAAQTRAQSLIAFAREGSSWQFRRRVLVRASTA